MARGQGRWPWPRPQALHCVLPLLLLACAPITDSQSVAAVCLTASPETRQGTQRPAVQSGQGPLGQGTEARAQLGECGPGTGQTVEAWSQRWVCKRQLWRPHVEGREASED